MWTGFFSRAPHLATLLRFAGVHQCAPRLCSARPQVVIRLPKMPTGRLALRCWAAQRRELPQQETLLRFGARKIQRPVEGNLRFARMSQAAVKFAFRGMQERIPFGLAIHRDRLQSRSRAINHQSLRAEKKAGILSIFAKANRLLYRRATRSAENWSRINRIGRQVSSGHPREGVRIFGSATFAAAGESHLA